MRSKQAVWIALLAVMWVCDVRAQTDGSNPLLLTLEPERIVNGSPCLFRVVSTVPLRGLAAKWQNRIVYFDFDNSSRSWFGLGGVGLEAVAGNHPLILNALLSDGSQLTITYDVPVYAVRYPTSELSVEDQFTDPNKAQRMRIKAEVALKQTRFKSSAQRRLWTNNFSSPLNSIVTEGFGVQRLFNGKHDSIHQGLDFRADTGTPISAMNSGTVLLAQSMFYEGGFVVIDHGYGWMTLYLHLSSFAVREGETVKRGQLIAYSGGTGRVTSPHLHVGVRWQGMYIDPTKLFQLSLPGSGKDG